MSLTTDTRWDSFEKLDRNRLHSMVLSVLSENKDKGLTAREVSIILHNRGLVMNATRQMTAPRITELVNKGEVKVIGKKFDDLTQRKVAVYSIA